MDANSLQRSGTKHTGDRNESARSIAPHGFLTGLLAILSPLIALKSTLGLKLRENFFRWFFIRILWFICLYHRYKLYLNYWFEIRGEAHNAPTIV